METEKAEDKAVVATNAQEAERLASGIGEEAVTVVTRAIIRLLLTAAVGMTFVQTIWRNKGDNHIAFQLTPTTASQRQRARQHATPSSKLKVLFLKLQRGGDNFRDQ